MSTATLLAAAPTNVWEWLGDSSQRRISGSIPENLWITLWHSVLGMAIAAVVAIPLALWLAHHRRAEVLSTWIANLGRVIPTITIMAIFVVISLRNGLGFEPWPIVLALALLAIPPLFANTYTAVRQVSPDAVSAARAMGLTEGQVMSRIELPMSVPLIMAGLRTALTQLVATEALGALFGGRGLGLYIRYGFAGGDQGLYEIQAGALLVAGTAMTVDLFMWLLTRAVTPTGLGPTRPARGARSPILQPKGAP